MEYCGGGSVSDIMKFRRKTVLCRTYFEVIWQGELLFGFDNISLLMQFKFRFGNNCKKIGVTSQIYNVIGAQK